MEMLVGLLYLSVAPRRFQKPLRKFENASNGEKSYLIASTSLASVWRQLVRLRGVTTKSGRKRNDRHGQRRIDYVLNTVSSFKNEKPLNIKVGLTENSN